MQWNIENIIVIILIKRLQMNKILVLNNPKGVDTPLIKLNWTKSKQMQNYDTFG